MIYKINILFTNNNDFILLKLEIASFLDIRYKDISSIKEFGCLMDNYDNTIYYLYINPIKPNWVYDKIINRVLDAIICKRNNIINKLIDEVI